MGPLAPMLAEQQRYHMVPISRRAEFPGSLIVGAWCRGLRLTAAGSRATNGLDDPSGTLAISARARSHSAGAVARRTCVFARSRRPRRRFVPGPGSPATGGRLLRLAVLRLAFGRVARALGRFSSR